MDIPDSFQEAFNELKARRGDCPGSDELLQYQQKSLPEEQLVKTKQHIDSCGLCDSIVTRLAQFDSAVTEKPKQSIPWMVTVRQFFLQPAVAYLVALALLYPAYVGIFRKPVIVEKITKAPAPPIQGVGSAQDFDLGEGTVQRGGSPSLAPVQVIRISAEEKFFILNFFVPVRPDRRYEMQIVDDKGEQITAGKVTSRDRLGNFSLVCTWELFPPDPYVLTIKELEQNSQQVHDEYFFRFTVQSKPVS
ncbi:hypothetical protein L0156_15010 [bacterium]|nr:hypothetical protein [bacterium]